MVSSCALIVPLETMTVPAITTARMTRTVLPMNVMTRVLSKKRCEPEAAWTFRGQNDRWLSIADHIGDQPASYRSVGNAEVTMSESEQNVRIRRTRADDGHGVR